MYSDDDRAHAAYPQNTYRARDFRNYQFWPRSRRCLKNYSRAFSLIKGFWWWGVTNTSGFIEAPSKAKDLNQTMRLDYPPTGANPIFQYHGSIIIINNTTEVFMFIIIIIIIVTITIIFLYLFIYLY